MKSYYVYILASSKNGTLYIGVTSDLVKRIHEHYAVARGAGIYEPIRRRATRVF